MNNSCGCSGNSCAKGHKCKSVTKKPIGISTPVRVEPTVKPGRIRTKYERPQICWPAESEGKCACDFVIKQTIYVEIPMYYNVETDVGESYVDCKT